MLFNRLWPWRSRKGAGTHSIPPGQRVYAIGDIHGRLDLLDELLAKIDRDDAERGPSDTLLIFLGDLVDRGPDSCGVIHRLLDLKRSGRNARFLMGNHEEIFLQALSGDVKATRYLVGLGGKATIMSYGVSEEEYQEATFQALTEILRARVPMSHTNFLLSFERWVEVGDYLFVHAGIRPGISIEQQSEKDLRSIRTEFLAHYESHGRMIVHGHSISEEVDIRPNRIGIDTGAYGSGRLTAIGLDGHQRWFLST